MARQSRLTKKQSAEIKAIKAKGYSASYEARLIRGVKAGKSRQQSRGHKVKEHIIRKEKEKENNEGLTNAQIKSIQRWHEKFGEPRRVLELNMPEVEDVIDYTRENGFDKFTIYRKTWNKARREFVNSGEDRASSRGLGWLDILYSIAELNEPASIEWLYYH